jgi:DNA repair exonuclease SbcCD nuclease subunit
MKILHTADWHWSERHLDKCIQSAEFIIERMKALRPDLHVIAGDYWDRRQVLSDSSAVLPAVEIMKVMASISPVVIVLGNFAHDVPGSLGLFNNLYTRYPVFVTEGAESILLYQSKHGKPERFECFPIPWDSDADPKEADALIHLMAYPNKSRLLASSPDTSLEESNQMLCDALRKVFLGFAALGDGLKCPKIFVGHCTIEGASLSNGQTIVGQDIKISKHDLDMIGADYYALGHIHSNQMIQSNMWYSGSIYHHDYGEAEAKYLNIVEITKGTVKVSREEIPTRPMALHEITYDARSCTFLDENTEADWVGADLRVRLHIGIEQSKLVGDDEIKKNYPGVETIKVERIIIPEERIRWEYIAHARTLGERILEWGKSIDKKIPPEVLEIAAQMESSLHHDASVESKGGAA